MPGFARPAAPTVKASQPWCQLVSPHPPPRWPLSQIPLTPLEFRPLTAEPLAYFLQIVLVT